MCGIAGCIGTEPVSLDRIQATLARMRRRGPDATGVAKFREGPLHVSLLHSRLKIIDLDDRANQPLSRDGRTMVFNGELYNYREIRADLEKEGVSFRTTSDSEVLLAALAVRGWDVLEDCEGMWAFALFDDSDGTLTLSRDRFGEKPLFWMHDEGAFYFGSEPKYLFALRGRSAPPNRDHLRRFLANGYRSLFKTPETFFEGVHEVPSGSCLRIREGVPETPRRYWRLPEPVPEMDLPEAVRATREGVLRAVELRLRADVPLAFCMSGGVDSNALIATAKRCFDYDVHGFLVANEDDRYDERTLARASADALGVRLTEVPVRPEGFLENLRAIVAHHDAPVATASYYVHWLLMREIAAAGYRVSVSGTGADELFSGYYDHPLHLLRDLRADPEALREARAAWERNVKPFVRNPLLRDPDRFLAKEPFRGHLYDGSETFASWLLPPGAEPFAEVDFSPGSLRNRMCNELFHEVVPPILREDDGNAMYFSVENRSPFLDRALFETSLRISTRHLIQDGTTKAVLREAMRGIVPDAVLDSRRKVGFNAPVRSFWGAESPDVAAWLRDDGPVYEIVRRETVLDLLQKATLTDAENKFLFSFLGTKIFLETSGD